MSRKRSLLIEDKVATYTGTVPCGWCGRYFHKGEMLTYDRRHSSASNNYSPLVQHKQCFDDRESGLPCPAHQNYREIPVDPKIFERDL